MDKYITTAASASVLYFTGGCAVQKATHLVEVLQKVCTAAPNGISTIGTSF